jgi:hypothetical protein
MANENDPQPPSVTPQPGVVKTIGVFNLIFGGILLLCGMGCLNPVLPSLINQETLQIDPKKAQQVLDEDRRQRITELKAREQSASTPDEKAKIKEQRLAVEASRPKVEGQLDFPTVNAGLAWLTRYVWADVATGPLLNLLMGLSGIGLILRKNWARLLGLVTAGLKIVRLLALGVLLVAVVVPKMGRALDVLADSPLGKEMFDHAMERQKAQGGGPPPGPQPGPKEVAQYLRAFGNVSAVLLPCLGSIYPVITLVLLTRPGARAACLVGDEEEMQEEPPFGTS